MEVLDNYLAERGYIMPLDLGAKGRYDTGPNFHDINNMSTFILGLTHSRLLIVVILEAMLRPTQEAFDFSDTDHFTEPCLD